MFVADLRILKSKKVGCPYDSLLFFTIDNIVSPIYLFKLFGCYININLPIVETRFGVGVIKRC